MLLQKLVKKKTNLITQFFLTSKHSFHSTPTQRGADADAGATGNTVMSFGDGTHGALGLPTSTGIITHSYEPTPIPGLPPTITTIGAGHYHSLAVTSRGEVWAWGRNNEFQLGRGIVAAVAAKTCNDPMKVSGLEGVRVKDVYASGVVSAALGDDGSLWVWGKSKRGQLGVGQGVLECGMPTRVEALAGERVAKVAFGWGHALACTEDGKLFGWGYCGDGRLGQIEETVFEGAQIPASLPSLVSIDGKQDSSSALFDMADKIVLENMEKEKNMPIIWEPRLLQESHGVTVTDVACGDDHSLVLCSDGTLLSGGNNTYGQLGRSKELGLLPIELEFKPLSISSGLGHSLAVCQIPSSHCNGILTWGWNSNSQLGRTGPENIPMMVQGLEGESPVSVAGGRVHSIAITSKGELWAWGCGKNGRLGLGSPTNEDEPIMIDLVDAKFIKAVCGYDHNLVLVTDP